MDRFSQIVKDFFKKDQPRNSNVESFHLTDDEDDEDDCVLFKGTEFTIN